MIVQPARTLNQGNFEQPKWKYVQCSIVPTYSDHPQHHIVTDGRFGQLYWVLKGLQPFLHRFMGSILDVHISSSQGVFSGPRGPLWMHPFACWFVWMRQKSRPPLQPYKSPCDKTRPTSPLCLSHIMAIWTKCFCLVRLPFNNIICILDELGQKSPCKFLLLQYALGRPSNGFASDIFLPFRMTRDVENEYHRKTDFLPLKISIAWAKSLSKFILTLTKEKWKSKIGLFFLSSFTSTQFS